MGVRGVGDTESWQMMSKYRRHGNESGEMTFEEFRDCMLDYLRIPGEGALGSDDGPSAEYIAAKSAVEKAVGKRVEVFLEACNKFDPEGRGEVDYGQLRSVLDSVGARLSKDQFAALCAKFDPTDDGGIFYREMIGEIGGFGTVDKTAAALPNSSSFNFDSIRDDDIVPVVNPSTGAPYAVDELVRRVCGRIGLSEAETRLLYSLFGRKESLKEAFLRFDINKDGRVRRHCFIDRFIFSRWRGMDGEGK
jgi:hypothetical protein